MFGFDTNGEIENVVAQDADSYLSQRGEHDANLLYFAKESGGYPLLQIHVTADRALLHFFAEEGRPGWISRNPIDELDVDELVTFFESENGASIQVSKANVFSVTDASKALNQFLETNEIPNSISWYEL